jgi:hypothetical protein
VKPCLWIVNGFGRLEGNLHLVGGTVGNSDPGRKKGIHGPAISQPDRDRGARHPFQPAGKDEIRRGQRK